MTQQKSDPSTEEWRVIPKYPPYEASSEGRIRNKKGRILSQTLVQSSYKAYYKVGVARNKKGHARKEFVHRLVCLAFHGEPPPGMNQVCHFPDGDTANNRADNLKWGNASINRRHQNGDLMCECDHQYRGHHDEQGYCTEMNGDEHCQCSGFVKKRDRSTASAE